MSTASKWLSICQRAVWWWIHVSFVLSRLVHITENFVWRPCLTNKPELRSRPGLNARLLTVGESLSQQMVLETLVLKFPSNLNTHKQATFWEFIERVQLISFFSYHRFTTPQHPIKPTSHVCTYLFTARQCSGLNSKRTTIDYVIPWS